MICFFISICYIWTDQGLPFIHQLGFLKFMSTLKVCHVIFKKSIPLLLMTCLLLINFIQVQEFLGNPHLFQGIHIFWLPARLCQLHLELTAPSGTMLGQCSLYSPSPLPLSPSLSVFSLVYAYLVDCGATFLAFWAFKSFHISAFHP